MSRNCGYFVSFLSLTLIGVLSEQIRGLSIPSPRNNPAGPSLSCLGYNLSKLHKDLKNISLLF